MLSFSPVLLSLLLCISKPLMLLMPRTAVNLSSCWAHGQVGWELIWLLLTWWFSTTQTGIHRWTCRPWWESQHTHTHTHTRTHTRTHTNTHTHIHTHTQNYKTKLSKLYDCEPQRGASVLYDCCFKWLLLCCAPYFRTVLTVSDRVNQ